MSSLQTTTDTTTGKSKYRSATLPSKRKTALQQMEFADDNFAKMTPDYGEANNSQEQVRIDLIIVYCDELVCLGWRRSWGEFTKPQCLHAGPGTIRVQGYWY